jgi:hypothetical protein
MWRNAELTTNNLYQWSLSNTSACLWRKLVGNLVPPICDKLLMGVRQNWLITYKQGAGLAPRNALTYSRYSHILSMWSLGFQLPWSPWLKTAKLRSSEWCSYGTPVGRWVSNWQLGLDVGGPWGYDILRPMDTDFMVQCVGEKAWCLNMLRSEGYSGYSLSLLVGVAVSHKNSLRELWRPSEAARGQGPAASFPWSHCRVGIWKNSWKW